MSEKNIKNEDKDVTKEPQNSINDNVVKKPQKLTGVVRNCELLNVRKEPSKESDVVKTIKRDDKIDILKDESTKDFYKTTDGYVMKHYIKTV